MLYRLLDHLGFREARRKGEFQRSRQVLQVLFGRRFLDLAEKQLPSDVVTYGLADIFKRR
jgi:hypothetical protein